MKGSRLCRWAIKTIAAKVRGGSYPWPAARSLRIGRSAFFEWVKIGRRRFLEAEEAINAGEEPDVPDGKPERGLTREELCYELYVAIEEALGGSEVDASEWLFEHDKAEWLKRGPARKRWKTESKTTIEGQIGHDMSLVVQCPVPLETLGEGVEIIQSLGIPLADGRVFRQIGTKPSVTEAEPSDGNGTAE